MWKTKTRKPKDESEKKISLKLTVLAIVLIALFMGLNLENLNYMKIAEYCFIVLYLTYVILICGIDKENRKIDKYVNVYGIAISIMYMLYLYIVEDANIYRYGIYLILYILILIFDTITLKRFAKSTYTNGILLMLVTMIVFTNEYVTLSAIIFTLLAMATYILLYKLKNRLNTNMKTDRQVSGEISIGFYLGVTNLIIFILVLIYNNYIL